jgi:hypothetical protein
MEDDVYNGYFLPKDAIVLGNAWYVLSRVQQVDDNDTESAAGEFCMTSGSSLIPSNLSLNASLVT